MIIVTGSVTAKSGSFEALRDACQAYVQRSRKEDGCISHAVRVDSEEPLKLVFFEEWRDMAALRAHFVTPGVKELLATFQEHSAASEPITAYEAKKLPPLAG